MSYADKSLQCVECRASFTFSASEQDFFATRGYTNEFKRCPSVEKLESNSVVACMGVRTVAGVAMATNDKGKCMLPSVPLVAKTRRYRSSHETGDRGTAVAAIPG